MADGKEEKLNDMINGPSMASSRDSGRMADLAREGEHWVAVEMAKKRSPSMTLKA